MKLGYSLLLLEHVDADKIGYDDCKAFQIVCPACREPIFKAVREESHFLSHYGSERAFASECELRVASLSGADRARAEVQGRGQRLRYFLGVLESAALSGPFSDLKDLPDGRWRDRSRLQESKGYRHFIDLVRRKLVRTSADKLWTAFAAKQQELDGPNLYLEGATHTFGEDVQRRIAADVILAVLTDKARPLFETIAYLAAADTRIAYGPNVFSDAETRTDEEIAICDALDALAHGNRAKQFGGLKTLEVLKSEQPAHKAVLDRLISEVAATTFGVIANIDFADLLRSGQRR